eukprot:SAG31_NODE_15_length_37942_cov_32.078297_36_plen_58_part_00
MEAWSMPTQYVRSMYAVVTNRCENQGRNTYDVLDATPALTYVHRTYNDDDDDDASVL